jgi:hypothetical protein
VEYADADGEEDEDDESEHGEGVYEVEAAMIQNLGQRAAEAAPVYQAAKPPRKSDGIDAQTPDEAENLLSAR